LNGAGFSYPTLRYVCYAKQQLDSEKKKARNILLKMGIELLGPDFMLVNFHFVVHIDAVVPDSSAA
jgi:hypothetical protein